MQYTHTNTVEYTGILLYESDPYAYACHGSVAFDSCSNSVA